jgi:hypothetical protein
MAGDRTHSAIAFIKGDMTKNMAAFFDGVHEEVETSLEKQLGECSGQYLSPFLLLADSSNLLKEWIPRSAYWLSVDMNLRIFERVFVGLDLCRKDKWVRPFVSFLVSLSSLRQVLVAKLSLDFRMKLA